MSVPQMIEGMLSLFKSPKKARNDSTPPPSDIASTPEGVPVNILAFRTITTILAQLPRSTPIEAVDNLEGKITDPDDRQELRISDAFAHLAVGEHDVAALTTNRSSPDGAKLRVVACTNDFPVGESLPTSPLPGNLIAKMNVLYLMLTRNFLRDEVEASSGTPHPTIISPDKPGELEGRNAFAYMVGLELYRTKPSLPTHLWILSNVLIGTDHTVNGRKQFRPDLCKHLSRYIAAMSYKKMARRFNNKNLSRPYIESLKQVEEIPFMSQPMRERAANGRRERDEADSDRLFLQDFVMLYTECPDMLNTQIPNLLKMANNLPPNNGVFQLYTNETRTEFHHLLLEILDRFKQALDALVALDKDKAAKDSNQAVEQFKENLGDVHRNGYALLRLSRGRAFQMHLENIETLIEDPRRSNAAASIEEHDEELEAIRSVPSPKGLDSAARALLKSYVAWLRLMVGHFDAVEILVRYVTSRLFPYDSISIEILVAPPTDSALLPWSQLFDKYIPQTGAVAVASSAIITNDEIHDFLAKGISTASEAKKCINHLQNASKAWDNLEPELHKTRQSLQNFLADSTDNVDKGRATEILAKVRRWKKSRGSDDSRVEIGVEITNEIKALRDTLGELSDSARFFLNLDNTSFRGTLHCEACLASLLPAFTRDIAADNSNYKKINILPRLQGFGPVIGVSKRCCPVCAVFLHTLMKEREEKFLVRGSHGTVSACTLPLWTPSNIVDAMNQAFGVNLRQDLVTFMNDMAQTPRFRNRSKSTGSQTLSLDSSGSDEGSVSQALSDTMTRR